MTRLIESNRWILSKDSINVSSLWLDDFTANYVWMAQHLGPSDFIYLYSSM
jgi:hypothetical protein